MSLLLLFNGGNPPPSASTTEPYAQVLLETENNVFVDISADLRSGTTNRGRQQELQRYQSGTCSLELSNEDRAYDPSLDGNLFAPRNSTFESGVSDWINPYPTVPGGTVAVDNSIGFSGTSSLKLTTGSLAIVASAPSTFDYKVRPGRPYSMLFQIRPVAGVLLPRVAVDFLYYNNNRTLLTTAWDPLNPKNQISLTAGSWTKIVVPTVPPSGARFVRPHIFVIGDSAADDFNIDEIALQYGNVSTFTANQPISPYYPDIKPGRRLQVFGSYGGTTWPQFTGKVDDWSERSNGPNDAVALLQATDAMADLNDAALPSSAYYLEVMADDPVVWYHLGEPDNSATLFDAVGSKDLTVSGNPTGSVAGLISREPDTALEFVAATDYAINESGLTSLIGSIPLSIEFVIDTTDTTGGFVLAQVANSGNPAPGFNISLETDGKLYIVGGTDGQSAFSVNTSVVVNDGTPHHVVFTWNSSNSVTAYVDGVDVTQGTNNTTGTTFTAGKFWLGFSSNSVIGIIDEVAFYDTALSATRVAAHSAAKATPWNGDTPGARVARLLDFVAFPGSSRDLDTGSSTLQSATLGTSALEHAQKVSESEFGAFFVTAGGVIRLDDRHNVLNKTSQGTFSDQPGDSLVYKDSTPKYDKSLIKNDVTISRSAGAAQTVTDKGSIGEYGRRSYSLDGLLHNSDDLSLDAAEFLVNEYSEPKRRITDMLVGPVPAGKEAAMYPKMLGTELTDKLTVTEWPQKVGSPIVQESIVEGIQQTFGPTTWQTKYQLSPALAGAFWQIGRIGYSEIGLTTRIYF